MNANREILVGYDGSAAAHSALAWALDTAAQAGSPVEVLYVNAWPAWTAAAPFVPATSIWPDAEAERRVTAMLDDALLDAAASHPHVVVRTAIAHGVTADVLLDRSRHAAMVVLGSHGHSGWSEVLLPPISMVVSAHAHCPVVVVRGFEPDGPDTVLPVVVGLDDSPAAQLALGFAAEQAAAREVPLTVVRAWPPERAGRGDELVDPSAIARAEREQAEHLLTGWREKYPAVPVDIQVVCEQPATALVSASRAAQLVVVGSRGLGRLRGHLLSSISHQVLHRAHCPVAVVRELSTDLTPAGAG